VDVIALKIHTVLLNCFLCSRNDHQVPCPGFHIRICPGKWWRHSTLRRKAALEAFDKCPAQAPVQGQIWVFTLWTA